MTTVPHDNGFRIKAMENSLAETFVTALQPKNTYYEQPDYYQLPEEFIKLGLPSPAIELDKTIVKLLKEKYQVPVIDGEKLDKAVEGNPYQLQVVTSTWKAVHHPIAVTNYKIVVQQGINFSNVYKPKTLHHLSCSYAGNSDYSYDDLLKDGGAVIRKEVDTAVNECVKKFGEAVSGVKS